MAPSAESFMGLVNKIIYSNLGNINKTFQSHHINPVRHKDCIVLDVGENSLKTFLQIAYFKLARY
jgi:hypothetical protein